MKSILEFELPEDNYNFILAYKGHVYYNALWQLQVKIKNLWKYSDNEDDIKIGEKFQEIFNEIIDDYNVNLDEVN
jgi:hypothetical protein